MGEFNEEQTAYIKAEVDNVEGFEFVGSNPMEAPPKMSLRYINPKKQQRFQNTPIGKNKDWATDQKQFEAMVADAVDVMKKDV